MGDMDVLPGATGSEWTCIKIILSPFTTNPKIPSSLMIVHSNAFVVKIARPRKLKIVQARSTCIERMIRIGDMGVPTGTIGAQNM